MIGRGREPSPPGAEAEAVAGTQDRSYRQEFQTVCVKSSRLLAYRRALHFAA